MKNLLMAGLIGSCMAAQAATQVWWSNGGVEQTIKITLDVQREQPRYWYGYFTFAGDPERNIRILDKWTFTEGTEAALTTAMDIGVFLTVGGKTGYSVGRAFYGTCFEMLGKSPIGAFTYEMKGWHMLQTGEALYTFTVLDGADSSPTGQPLPGVLATALVGGAVTAGAGWLRQRKQG